MDNYLNDKNKLREILKNIFYKIKLILFYCLFLL